MTEILQYPDPLLSDVSTQFSKNEMSEACALAAHLRVALGISPRPGIGLAAPQIGVTRCLFVLDSKHLRIPGNGVFINPEIIWKSTDMETHEEGCLSFPEDIWVDVIRPVSIRLKYWSTSGDEITLAMRGLPARAAQHEMDHLNGQTIAKFLSRQVRRNLIRKAEKL